MITSSDDVHYSHFLLPGFFKTITTKPTEKDAQQETPAADKGIFYSKDILFSLTMLTADLNLKYSLKLN